MNDISIKEMNNDNKKKILKKIKSVKLWTIVLLVLNTTSNF